MAGFDLKCERNHSRLSPYGPLQPNADKKIVQTTLHNFGIVERWPQKEILGNSSTDNRCLTQKMRGGGGGATADK